MTEVKTSKTGPVTTAEKAAPSAGLFGFAGTTLFQPGQPLFSGEPEVLPDMSKSKPNAADKPE